MSGEAIRIVLQDVDEDEAVSLLEGIARQAADGGAEGEVAGRRWRIDQAGTPVPVDRRQLLAAAALVMGFDLPQTLASLAHSMRLAAEICPDLLHGEIPSSEQDRRRMLEAARGLIDEMLAESAT